MRKHFGTLFIVALICLALPTAPALAQKLSFSIVTGGTGGVWYPLGGAIGGVIGKSVPNTDATAEVTTAAIDNLKLLAAGKAGMAFAYDYHTVWANEGKIAELSKKQPVRIVMGFYEQPLHIVTKEGTGIKSVMDLKGKRVSVGAPNSGTEEQADYVLKGLGYDWNKDFKREKLGAGESVAALKDGKIDAMFWSGAIPTSSIIDLASTPGRKLVLLPIDGEIRDKIFKGNPGVFHPTVFKKGAYTGLDSDVPAIAITAVLTAMDKFPQDKMYEIVKTIFDSKLELSAVWKGANDMTPETAVNQVTPDALKYLHPGAQKYFKEKGALKTLLVVRSVDTDGKTVAVYRAGQAPAGVQLDDGVPVDVPQRLQALLQVVHLPVDPREVDRPGLAGGAVRLREVPPGDVGGQAPAVGEAHQVLLDLRVAVRLDGLDSPLDQRLGWIRHHEAPVHPDDPPEAPAGLAGPQGGVE